MECRQERTLKNFIANSEDADADHANSRVAGGFFLDPFPYRIYTHGIRMYKGKDQGYSKMNISIMQTVVKHLLNEVEDVFSADDITIESRLRDDLNLNSLQAVNMIIELEDELNISISEDELAHFETVGDVVSTIQNKLSDKE